MNKPFVRILYCILIGGQDTGTSIQLPLMHTVMINNYIMWFTTALRTLFAPKHLVLNHNIPTFLFERRLCRRAVQSKRCLD